MPDSNICTECDPKVYEFVNTDNLQFYSCSRCDVKLCLSHYSLAKENGEHYGYGKDYAMCDQCCGLKLG